MRSVRRMAEGAGLVSGCAVMLQDGCRWLLLHGGSATFAWSGALRAHTDAGAPSGLRTKRVALLGAQNALLPDRCFFSGLAHCGLLAVAVVMIASFSKSGTHASFASLACY